MTWVITWIVDCGDGVPVPERDLCYPLHNAARPMTDPKNTEDQELSLEQLKDAAGGISADARGKTTGLLGYPGSGSESVTTSDDAGGVVESLRSDNRF